MKKIALVSLITSSILLAGGYKIPESSLNAVALGAANVAHNKSADAAYYNPANMVFMTHDGVMEIDMMYIGLSEIDYKGTYTDSTGTTTGPYNIHSKSENFLIPSFHYVSPEIDGARFGFSMVVPAGLSKRWVDSPAIKSAEEFTLETIELNPTVALPIGDKVGIAIGIRAIYSYGVVKAQPVAGGLMSQDMEGDSIDFGYNLAFSYKPTKELELAVTYRSKVDLSTEGDADLVYNSTFLPGTNSLNGNYSVSLDIPVPALFNAAIAYTFPTDTTIEFVYERNYWHAYKEIDFNYDDAVAEAIFGTAKPKNWKDTNTFRFGITQELDDLTLMSGLVIDESPIPESTLGYELPDSDSVSVSLGARYQFTEKINAGIAALYSMREDRTVHNDSLDGEFTNATALLISLGLEYKF
jgi:long-chain fatty acid transport protein